MAYRLIITERAEELLEQRVNYILYKFRNEQATRHLLDGIEQLYDRLEDNVVYVLGIFHQLENYKDKLEVIKEVKRLQ